MTEDELWQVQLLVNEKIRQNARVLRGEDSYTSAINRGALAFFGDKKAQGIAHTQGQVQQLDPVNAHTVLKMDLQRDPAVVLQMVYAAIAAGLIPDKSKDKTITSSYVCPELDITGIPSATEV